MDLESILVRIPLKIITMDHSEFSTGVTQKDVARALGVTQATVSMALRNDPQIPEARRKEIQEMAAKMGYRANASATALIRFRQASKVVPVHASLAWLNFWPKPEELHKVPLFRANWEGAVAAAERLGYRIEEFVCGGEKGFAPQRLKSILEAQGIQGILLPPQRPPVPADAFEFDWKNFAAIRIGHTVTHPAVHVVTHSQASDTLLACKMIREKGYKRIGHLTSETLDCYAFFEAGFLKSQLLSSQEDRIPLLVLENNPEPNERVLKQIDDWMKQYRPDAILSTEGNIVSLLNAAGYRVPQDVAVAASSVRNSDADAGIFENPEEVGRAAVKTLISQLQRHEFGVPEFPQDILVHGMWEDGSTLPPKG